MREGWEKKRWKDVLEIRSGRNQKDVEHPQGKYPILGSAGKVMGYANDFLCEEGSTIIGRKGTIDNPLFISTKFWNVDTAFGLHALQGLDKRFLYYFCRSFDFTKQDKGSGRPSLVKSDLLQIEIPIPPLPEQRQIVSILDQAFAAIDQAKANIERNIENAKELFQSKLNEVFSQRGDGWVEKKLGEVTKKIGSGATPKGGQASYKESGISLIRSMNVHDNGFRSKNLAFIDEGQANKLKNVTVEENDVLLNITGASVARCCVVNNSYLPARVNQHVSIIRLKEEVLNHKFLHFALISKITKDILLGIGEQGSTRQAITKTQIESFKVRYPSELSKQIEIVNSLEKIKLESEKLESAYLIKLETLSALKKSILQKAFSGELTSVVSATSASSVTGLNGIVREIKGKLKDTEKGLKLEPQEEKDIAAEEAIEYGIKNRI